MIVAIWEFDQNFENNFVSAFEQNSKLKCLSRSMFVNVNKTTIYFKTNPTPTVHSTGCKSIAIRGSGSCNHRMIAYSAVASACIMFTLVVTSKN